MQSLVVSNYIKIARFQQRDLLLNEINTAKRRLNVIVFITNLEQEN